MSGDFKKRFSFEAFFYYLFFKNTPAKKYKKNFV